MSLFCLDPVYRDLNDGPVTFMGRQGGDSTCAFADFRAPEDQDVRLFRVFNQVEIDKLS